MVSLASLERLFHTVRHLRARQIAGQVGRRLAPLCAAPELFATRAAPPWPGCRGRPRAELLPPVVEAPAERIREGWFTFQGRPERLAWPPDWEAPGLPSLWRYHLHYFEFLWRLDFAQARALALDWIGRHPLGGGRVGWDAYPISLRLQNGCGYFFGRHRERTAADPAFEAALWRSIQLQAEWLRAHLEWHLLGNHLLENGVALATAGSCFAGAAGDAWLRAGLAILRREVPEQILSDGGHFERSPMYQARVLHTLATLLAWGSDEIRSVLEEPVARMARALVHLCHPQRGAGGASRGRLPGPLRRAGRAADRALAPLPRLRPRAREHGARLPRRRCAHRDGLLHRHRYGGARV